MTTDGKKLESVVSVRMSSSMHQDVAIVAQDLGLKPADVIRLCIISQIDQFKRTGEWVLNGKKSSDVSEKSLKSQA